MMKKPWVIGLLSVVPGVGLMLLGETTQGFAALAAIVVLVLTYLLAPWRVVYELSCGLVFVLWVAQMYVAVATARRQGRIEAGDAQVARQPLSEAAAAAGSSRGERLLHQAREAVTHQLSPGEQVRVAITCQVMPSVGSHILLGPVAVATMRQFHIGVTDRDLVMVELDLMGKPAEVRRRPLTEVRLVGSKEGFLSDTLVLDVGERKPLRVQVARLVRAGTRQLEGMLGGKPG